MTIIKLSKHTEFPGPRYKRLGPWSGEWFRDDIIIPEIEKHGKNISIDLDDTIGYGSSFLEEAFGGLIRKGVDENTVLAIQKNLISNEDESLPIEILDYIQDAIKTKEKH